MTKYAIVLILFFANLITIQAQNEQIERVDASSRQKVSTYLAIGFIMGPEDFSGADMQYGASLDFQYGSRSYLNFANNRIFRLGTGVYYRNLRYRIDQDSDKLFPTTIQVDRERLSFHALGLEFFANFRFDGRSIKKQGIGIDIGAYGEWFAGTRQVSVLKLSDNNPLEEQGKKSKQVLKQLKYINRWHFGLLARVNFRNFTIYGDYRLSDIFDQDYLKERSLSGDFAKIILGIQLDM